MIVDYGLPLENQQGSQNDAVWRHMEDSRDALWSHFGVGASVFGWSRWRGRMETILLRVRMYASRATLIPGPRM